MMKFIHRDELNVDKYNSCISKSFQKTIYAYSWYLDMVSNNWSVFVVGDYDAVMPIPWKNKYGLRYISQPFFTQQLGIFSKEQLDEDLKKLFYKSIPKTFLKTHLQVNFDSAFSSARFTIKDNYLLALDKPYDLLFKDFSKGRKSAISFAKRQEVTCANISSNALITLAKENYSYTGFNMDTYTILAELIAVFLKKEIGTIKGVFHNNELIGGAVFVKDKNQIVYLFSAVNKKGKELQCTSLLLNMIVEKYAGTQTQLDFEGSMIPGVAKFFKSFGAIQAPYFLFKKTLL